MATSSNKSNDMFKVHKSTQPFTMVQNNLIENPKISSTAKWILIYLLSKPDGWTVRINDIVNHTADGETCIRNKIKELRELGYIVLSRIISNEGKFLGTQYDVYDEPLETPIPTHRTVQLDAGQSDEYLAEKNKFKKPNKKLKYINVTVEDKKEQLDKQDNSVENKGNNENDQKCEKPYLENPHTDKPHVENPHISNTNSSNTESSNTQSNQEKRLSKKEYIKAIKKQIDFATWEKSAQKQDVQLLHAIIGYMADLCFSKRQQIKINKKLLDTELVRNDFLNITLDALLQVLDIIKCQDYDINKPRPYIWTCVYNQINSDELEDSFSQLLPNMQKYDGSHEPPSYNLKELTKRGMNVPEM